MTDRRSDAYHMSSRHTEPAPRCCAVCPTFSLDAGIAETDIRLVETQLKGTGNANAVFGTTHGGIVARCRLHGSSKTRAEDEGREDRHQRLAALEKRVWSRRNLVFTGDPADDQLRYRSCIVAPFLGIQYLPLAARLGNAAFRAPAQHPSVHDLVATDGAILMADGTLLAGMPKEGVVCIEIKPKFGSTVRCETVPARLRHLKHSISRYQLHQSLKLEQGLIDRRSAYDPSDLFSNDPNRMKKAIDALIDCPQNNLALFLAGNRVPCEEMARRLDEACELLERVDTSHLVSTIQGILAYEGILNDILRMQTLCEHDVQAVEALLRQMTVAGPWGDGGCLGRRGAEDDGADDSDGYLGLFLDKMARAGESARLDLLADYCIATTAKDCSILVAMASSNNKLTESSTSSARSTYDASHDAPVKQGLRPCELGSFGGVCYRVTVVDLDCKSLRKLEGHKRLDEDIIRANL